MSYCLMMSQMLMMVSTGNFWSVSVKMEGMNYYVTDTLIYTFDCSC